MTLSDIHRDLDGISRLMARLDDTEMAPADYVANMRIAVMCLLNAEAVRLQAEKQKLEALAIVVTP